MAPSNGEQRSITFGADGDESESDPATYDFQWRSSWRRTLFNGWRQASTKETTEQTEQAVAETEEAAWKLASSIEPTTKLQWTSLEAEPHQTKAPQRYNEANLIQALEKEGIGRPSTFANLISTIQDKQYVETKSFEGSVIPVLHLKLNAINQWPLTEIQTTQKTGAEKDRLSLTPIGAQVLQYLTTHFDDLFQYKFTSNMESKLDAISEGKEPWKDVLRQTWTSYKDRYEVQRASKGSIQVSPTSMSKDFGNGLLAKMTKKGPLLLQESPDGDKDKTLFYGWPEGAELQTLTLEQAQAFIQQASKERLGEQLGIHNDLPIIRKQGKFGPYVLWNGKTYSCQLTDTLEQIIEKLSNPAVKALRIVGQFELRDGQYGPYMFKHGITGSSRKFVSIPKDVNIQEVNEAQLIAIYQHELQQKARSGAYGSSRAGQTGQIGQTGQAPTTQGQKGSFRGRRGSFRGRP